MLVLLRMRNLSEKTLKSLDFTYRLFDASGDPVEVRRVLYKDVNCAPHDVFGINNPIVTMSQAFEDVSITLQSVIWQEEGPEDLTGCGEHRFFAGQFFGGMPHVIQTRSMEPYPPRAYPPAPISAGTVPKAGTAEAVRKPGTWKKVLIPLLVTAAVLLVSVLGAGFVMMRTGNQKMMAALVKAFDLDIEVNGFEVKGWGKTLKEAAKINRFRFFDRDGNNIDDLEGKPETYAIYYIAAGNGTGTLSTYGGRDAAGKALFTTLHETGKNCDAALTVEGLGIGSNIRDFYQWMPEDNWNKDCGISAADPENNQVNGLTMKFSRLGTKMNCLILVDYDKTSGTVGGLEIQFYNKVKDTAPAPSTSVSTEKAAAAKEGPWAQAGALAGAGQQIEEAAPRNKEINFTVSSQAAGYLPKEPKIGISKEMTGASSELAESGWDHSAYMAFDGNPETSWQEDGSTEIGEYIEVDFGSPKTIDSMLIRPGNFRTEQLFLDNNVPTGFIMNIDGTDCRLSLGSNYRSSEIRFSEPIQAQKIRLTISEYRAGARYSDTCIADIIFCGR